MSATESVLLDYPVTNQVETRELTLDCATWALIEQIVYACAADTDQSGDEALLGIFHFIAAKCVSVLDGKAPRALQ